MVKVGDNFIYNAFFGDKTVFKIYYGNDCIWPGTDVTQFVLSNGQHINRRLVGTLT